MSLLPFPQFWAGWRSPKKYFGTSDGRHRPLPIPAADWLSRQAPGLLLRWCQALRPYWLLRHISCFGIENLDNLIAFSRFDQEDNFIACTGHVDDRRACLSVAQYVEIEHQFRRNNAKSEEYQESHEENGEFDCGERKRWFR